MRRSTGANVAAVFRGQWGSRWSGCFLPSDHAAVPSSFPELSHMHGAYDRGPGGAGTHPTDSARGVAPCAFSEFSSTTRAGFADMRCVPQHAGGLAGSHLATYGARVKGQVAA